MNKFKRFCLSLCFLLACCVGFLSTANITVYAYEKEDNFYPVNSDSISMQLFINQWESYTTYNALVSEDNKYKFNNPYTTNINAIQFKASSDFNMFDFPFNPDLFDYYFVGALVSDNQDVEKSTFKPQRIEMYAKDYATNTEEYYPLDNVGFYDLDSTNQSGFGWYGKVNFDIRENIGITKIIFTNDKDGLGNKPENLVMEMGILAVDKSNSEAAVLSQVLNQLQKMESSITENIQNNSKVISSALGQSAEKIESAINNQYEIEEDEDFGVGTITEQVEDKLGVLTVGTGTLVGFLDLFNSGNAGTTELVFPSFSITVQGEQYKVWEDISFDLQTLENDFGILINAVRTILVLCVWMAVLSYIVKAKDHVINNRG